MSDNHLDNKSIVVSGAAGGFGQRLCRALDLTALDALAAELDAGASLLTIPTDVTDLTAMRAAVA